MMCCRGGDRAGNFHKYEMPFSLTDMLQIIPRDVLLRYKNTLDKKIKATLQNIPGVMHVSTRATKSVVKR